jgi:hypothetical protein
MVVIFILHYIKINDIENDNYIIMALLHDYQNKYDKIINKYI